MQQAQIVVPPLTRINKYLILICAIFFILNLFVGISPWLSLHVPGIRSGLIFQIISYPLIPHSSFGFIFDALIIWFVGADIESRFGGKNYFLFLIFSILLPACVYLLGSWLFYGGMSAPLVGLTGISYALLLAYGVIFSERILTFMLIFPMKAKYFCLSLAAMQLLIGLTAIKTSSFMVILAPLSNMLFAFLFLRKFTQKGPSMLKKWSKNRKKQKFKVIDGEGDPKYWQ